MSPSECPFCRVASGALAPPGGALARERGWLVLGSLDPRRVAGWTVIAPERHIALADSLTGPEASALGDLIRRASAAVRAVTGAERVYLASFAEAVPHLHIHLFPRGPGVPQEDRGPGFLFDKAPRVAPEEADRVASEIVRLFTETQ